MLSLAAIKNQTVLVASELRFRIPADLKFSDNIKAGHKSIQLYFRKLPLHQQKILVFSVFSNSLWLQRYLKLCPR